MRTRIPAPLRTLVATLQVVMIGAWSPMMMARMAAHHDADPMAGMHHPSDARHGGNPLECCTLCPLTCAAPVGIASAPVSLPFPPAVARISASSPLSTLRRSLQERRLPYPAGPPALRTV